MVVIYWRISRKSAHTKKRYGFQNIGRVILPLEDSFVRKLSEGGVFKFLVIGERNMLKMVNGDARYLGDT